jgi:hypothetical protein
MKEKFLTGLATAVFLVGIISISHATTFSDDFDDPDFTNSHWLDGTSSVPQTWSSVILNGSDLGYHSTVDSLSTDDPAVKIADNGKEYNNAGLYIECSISRPPKLTFHVLRDPYLIFSFRKNNSERKLTAQPVSSRVLRTS